MASLVDASQGRWTMVSKVIRQSSTLSANPGSSVRSKPQSSPNNGAEENGYDRRSDDPRQIARERGGDGTYVGKPISVVNWQQTETGTE